MINILWGTCQFRGMCLCINKGMYGIGLFHIKNIELVPVKYLREVTPYFKKSSPLSDLGWGTHDSAQKDGAKANWSETKTIPLKLCYLCRNLTMNDPEKRTLELHSPDGKGLCALRFPDPATCSDWFNAIHSNVMLLNQQAIAEANQIISSAPNQRQIRHMGWLAEQVSKPLNS